MNLASRSLILSAVLSLVIVTACKDSDPDTDNGFNVPDSGDWYDTTGGDTSGLDTGERDGFAPDIAGQDLVGMDLVGVDLNGHDTKPIDVMSTIDTTYWDTQEYGDGYAELDLAREDLMHYDLGPEDEGSRPDYGACGEPGNCNPCGYGSVTGMTCAVGTNVGLPYAHVWIETTDCAGNPIKIEDYSDYQGYYVLDNVPCGTQTIHMEKGNFKHTFSRWIDKCVTTDVTSKDGCFPGQPARIAVVTGKWDVIEKTLIKLRFQHKQFDGLMDGPDAAMPQGGLLLTGREANTNTGVKNLTLIDDFDMVFIDCGDSPDYIMQKDGNKVMETLRAFVAKGGSVYASDYASVYVTQTWPSSTSGLTFPRDFPGTAGTTPRQVTADLPDPELAAYMQKPNAIVEYRLGPLTSIVGTPPAGTKVHVRGPNSSHANQMEPFMISWEPDGEAGGRVIITNFHNEEQLSTGDMAWVLQYVVFLM